MHHHKENTSLLLSVAFLLFSGCSDVSSIEVRRDGEIPSITADAAIVYEGDSIHLVEVVMQMDQAVNEVASIEYNTVDNSARSGTDFVQQTGKVLFYPGETRKSFQFPVIGDLVPEPEEQVEILFFSPFNALNKTPSIYIRILDDDQ